MIYLVFSLILGFVSMFLGFRLGKIESKRLYTVTDEDNYIIAEVDQREDSIKIIKGFNLLIDGYDVREVADFINKGVE